MSKVFFGTELEGVATYWQIARRDGVTLGFTSHNRDLYFDSINHRAAPGMLPSAIRLSAALEVDSVEVSGILSHDSICATDLASGRFENARIAIGLVDWESLASSCLFSGELGTVSAREGQFEAQLRSGKASLELDPVPRTSPTCRAVFCDNDCQLNANAFTHLAKIIEIDRVANRLRFDLTQSPAEFQYGSLRWVDGPQAGIAAQIISLTEDGLVLDQPLHLQSAVGMRALLREGCDHTIETCAERFDNARNFRGEPFMPGNDLLGRYPTGR